MANGLFSDFNPLMRLPTNQFGVAGSSAITKGTLVSFSYPKSFAMIPNVIHDFHPMVMITDIWPQWIRGVNLHYLDFKYVKWLLMNHGDKASFSYSHIGWDKYYMAKAFRMYARLGVKQPKKLDTRWLKDVLTQVRSFDPGEVEKIRTSIQRQIQARLQAKAKELTSYEAWRKQLSESQKRQFRGKVQDVHEAVTRGQRENLIMPAGQESPPDMTDTTINQPELPDVES